MWQPIETAPKDVKILICGGTWGCEYSPLEFSGWPFKEVALAIYNPEYSEWADDEYNYQPTHWMPLPEPPQETPPAADKQV
jgi:hypothetical protein